jgi:hypothetical protein
MAEIDPDRLESWKEIATFVGRTERTAMRWADEGMPVRKVRGRVYASRTEIQKWLAEHPSESAVSDSAPSAPPAEVKPNRNAYFFLGAITALVLVSLVVSRHWWPRTHAFGAITDVSFTEDSIQARDHEGHTIWQYQFPERFTPVAFKPFGTMNDFVRIVDLYGDGNREVLAVLPFHTGSSQEVMYFEKLVCFSSTGKLLWTYVPDGIYQFGNHELSGPWCILDLLVTHGNSKPTIWVTAIHHTWGDTFAAEVDPATGKGTARFMNTGVLYKLSEVDTARGSYLLAGGYNSEYQAGVLAIVDMKKPFAASPQTAGTRHKCDSCPPGSADFFFVFPQSEINELEKLPEDPVNSILVSQNVLEISKAELQYGQAVRIIYDIDDRSTFQVRSFLFDTGYDMLHAELQKQGKLDHSIAKCPERLHPKSVKMWTPDAGWTEIKFPPMKATD